jgi:hypothetical protein
VAVGIPTLGNESFVWSPKVIGAFDQAYRRLCWRLTGRCAVGAVWRDAASSVGKFADGAPRERFYFLLIAFLSNYDRASRSRRNSVPR